MNLICPKDRLPLTELKCSNGHEYPSFEGIPVLLRDDVPETIWTYTRSLKQAKGEIPIYEGNYVSELVASAAGHLYKHLIGNLGEYPIPDIPIEGSGTLLDVGCNWGRWTVSAAQKGFKVVGIDSALDALWAARQVCKELGVEAEFICADARYLPFPDDSFDQSFSFSVLQHFSKPDARLALNEMKRVAEKTKVEIPGKYGIRAFQHQLGRGFREPKGFEVRYWTPKELSEIGDVSVHAYFGTGVLSCDAHLMPWKYRMVVHASDALRRLSDAFPPLRSVADSYYVSF
jgi:SAM-dependent methyltransferase